MLTLYYPFVNRSLIIINNYQIDYEERFEIYLDSSYRYAFRRCGCLRILPLLQKIG